MLEKRTLPRHSKSLRTANELGTVRLGNAVQGFTHVTLISAAYNLSRTMHSRNEPAA
jgi:hypothetical protein